MTCACGCGRPIHSRGLSAPCYKRLHAKGAAVLDAIALPRCTNHNHGGGRPRKDGRDPIFSDEMREVSAGERVELEARIASAKRAKAEAAAIERAATLARMAAEARREEAAEAWRD